MTPRDLQRVRDYLRSAYASLVSDDVQSALLAVSDADRLLVELIDQDDPDQGRLRAA